MYFRAYFNLCVKKNIFPYYLHALLTFIIEERILYILSTMAVTFYK